MSELAKLKGEAGAGRAELRANKAITQWSERALISIKNTKLLRFQASELIEQAHKNGLPMPPDARAWGNVFKTAAKLGYIVFDGYEVSVSDDNHGAPVRVWLKQSTIDAPTEESETLEVSPSGLPKYARPTFEHIDKMLDFTTKKMEEVRIKNEDLNRLKKALNTTLTLVYRGVKIIGV